MQSANATWPLCVPPCGDEITSSWLVRVAHAYNETPTTLARLAWGKRAVWNRDTDLNLDPDMLEQLGTHLGLPPGSAAGTSLQAFLPRLGRLSVALVPGILTAGIYHRTRRRHGQQYCPECLAASPILLRHWRLAFVFSCPIHGSLLRDACPRCDSPLAIHRSVGNDVNHCHICQAPLAIQNTIPTAATLAAQQVLLDAWSTGSVCLGNFTVSFPEWLAGLRLLFSALQRPEFRNHVFPPLPPREERHSPLEFSRVSERAVLLPAAVWLTGKWPRRMLDHHRRSPLRAGTLIDSRRTQKPAWLVEAVQRNFPVQAQQRRTPIKVRVPSRLSTTLARRSLDLAPVITRRLDRLQTRH